MRLAEGEQLPAKHRGSFNLSAGDTISPPQRWPGLMSRLIAILMGSNGHTGDWS